MTRRTLVYSALFLFAGGLFWMACGGGGGGSSSSSSPAGPPANHVWVGGTGTYGSTTMSFTPATMTVAAGTTVTWDWKGGSHNVTSGTAPTADGLFNSGAAQTTGTFTHQFNTPGTFPYFCSVHGTMMTGTITVN